MTAHSTFLPVADLSMLLGAYLPLDAGLAAMRLRAAAPDAGHFRLKLTPSGPANAISC